MKAALQRKILFVNDTYDDNNLGCKATTNALYELIKEHLPSHEISGVIKLYHTERYNLQGAIPERFEQFDAACQALLLGRGNHELHFEVDKVQACDVVLINGEGSIYRDVLKCRYQLFLAFLAKKYFNKKVYMVNHTAELGLVKEMAYAVYSILDGIAAREPATKREIERLDMPNASKVVLAPDAVFKYTQPATDLFSQRLPAGFDPTRKFMIIGGSSLNNSLYAKWYGEWNKNSFATLIKALLLKTDVQIMLADVGGDDFLRDFDRQDRVFYSKFLFRDYMRLCSRALCHLSGRHHGSCLAAIAGCPIIGISANTHKMEGDFELLEWDLPVFSFYRIEEQVNDILAVVTDVIQHNERYRETMRTKAARLRNAASLNVTIIDSAGPQ